mgnify:CR=1 FL=1
MLTKELQFARGMRTTATYFAGLSNEAVLEKKLRLRELGDQIVDRDPRAGEERDFLPDVPAGFGRPKVTHQVDNAMQFGRLERENPFVVAERESGHSVGSDVLVPPCRHSVVGQHLAPFVVG